MSKVTVTHKTHPAPQGVRLTFVNQFRISTVNLDALSPDRRAFVDFTDSLTSQ